MGTRRRQNWTATTLESRAKVDDANEVLSQVNGFRAFIRYCFSHIPKVQFIKTEFFSVNAPKQRRLSHKLEHRKEKCTCCTTSTLTIFPLRFNILQRRKKSVTIMYLAGKHSKHSPNCQNSTKRLLNLLIKTTLQKKQHHYLTNANIFLKLSAKIMECLKNKLPYGKYHTLEASFLLNAITCLIVSMIRIAQKERRILISLRACETRLPCHMSAREIAAFFKSMPCEKG